MRRLKRAIGLLAAAAALALPSSASAQLGQRLLKQLAAPKAQNQLGPQYMLYDGQLHFEKVADPVCAVLTNGFYHLGFVAHINPGGGIEAYMIGEKIMHAHIMGSDRNHLDVNLLGENSSSRSLHLVAVGNGFVGTLQSKTLVSELFGNCPASNAEFTVSPKNGNAQELFQTYQQQFNLDLASEQDLALAHRGHIQEAMPRLQQAFAQKIQLYTANHPQMLRYYFSLAAAFDEAGLYPYAAYWYQKSVDVCLQAFGADNACVPITLLKLGQSLEGNGKPAEAEVQLRQAGVAAVKVFGQKAPVLWRFQFPLAWLLISTGGYREANDLLQQASTLAQQDAHGEFNVAVVNIFNAGLYAETGRYKLAEDTLRGSIDTLRRLAGHDTPVTVLATAGLANLLRLAGQSLAAEPLAKGALDAERIAFGPERPDHPIVSAVRVILAKTYIELGKSRDAEALLRQSLDGDRKYLGPNHPSVAVDELSLAAVMRTTDRESAAVPLIEDAYRISRMTPLQGLRWRAPAEFMQLYARGKTANPTLAIYYGKEAVNALQELRGGVAGAAGAGADGADGFIGAPEVKNVYDTLAHLLLTDQRLGEAQQVLALVSETEMAQFSERSILADAEPGPPAAGTSSPAAGGAKPDSDATRGLSRMHAKLPKSEAEKKLDDSRGDEITVSEEYYRLIQEQQEEGDEFGADKKARLAELQGKMDDIAKRFESLRANLVKSAKGADAKKYRAQEVDAFTTEIQGTLKDLGHGAVAATYFVDGDDLNIAFTTPSVAIPIVSHVGAAKLKGLIREFRRKLSSSSEDPLATSQQLYKILIGPIADDLKKADAKTLMLSLHGSLRYVPFAALHDGDRYLIESLAVVNVNDAARDKLPVQPKPADWVVWGLGVTKAGVLKTGEDYPALPNTREELSDIKKTLGGKSQISLDSEFTESRLQAGLGGNYPVIHIASHFLFTPHSSDESVLLLGDGSTLSLSQLDRKALNFRGVELLTLSACQTAVGDDSAGGDGSEVEALGNIAQRKGAMAVVASLWPVADESTAALMSALYKAHQTGLDKAEALQRAQLSLLHGTEGQRAAYAHPFYWAPFILMGNWL